MQESSFDARWWEDPAYKDKNEKDMKKRPAEISDPQKISISPWGCMDSGGWYMVFDRPTTVRQMDQSNTDVTQLVTNITLAINGGKIGLDERLKYTKLAKGVLS